MRRLLVALLLLLPACASMSPRAQLVQTHQSIEVLLATLDDAERVLCFGSTILPADPTRCTTSAAVLAGLTTQRHRALRRHFAAAFDAQVRVGAVIATWQPGTTVDMTTAINAAVEVSKQLDEMASVSGLIRDAARWLVELNRLKALFGGGA